MAKRIFIIKVLLFLTIISVYELRAMSSELLYAEDKIVAIVNNDVITQKDLNDFINFTRMQYSKEYKGRNLEEKMQSVKMNLLDKLIEDRIILQEARKKELNVDENVIEGRVTEIRRRYSSDREFQNELAKQGLVQADVENKIREQLLMYNIIQITVRRKIEVRPDEITDFYNKNIKDFMSPEERELTVITLENSDQARSFAYAFKTGQNLTDLAARYLITVDTMAAYKGGELRSEIEEVVFKLGINEVSNPVKLDEKYYVFRLDTVIPPRQLGLPQVQGKIQEFIFESRMQEELTRWLDELKKQSYIKILQN